LGGIGFKRFKRFKSFKRFKRFKRFKVPGSRLQVQEV
jgi:hypothetical protein